MYGYHQSHYPHQNVFFHHQSIPNFALFYGQPSKFQAFSESYYFPGYMEIYNQEMQFPHQEDFSIKTQTTQELTPKREETSCFEFCKQEFSEPQSKQRSSTHFDKLYFQKQNIHSFPLFAQNFNEIKKNKNETIACHLQKQDVSEDYKIGAASEQDSDNQKPLLQASYPKKNTESNITNKIFSFVLWDLKSKEVVERILEDEKKVNSFYQILKDIKKRKKKYINRKYLCSLCTVRQNQIGYKMLLRTTNKMNILSVKEFQKVLSILILFYLNKECSNNILTSKKINKSTHMQHLERTRQIKRFLVMKFKEVGDKE